MEEEIETGRLSGYASKISSLEDKDLLTGSGKLLLLDVSSPVGPHSCAAGMHMQSAQRLDWALCGTRTECV